MLEETDKKFSAKIFSDDNREWSIKNFTFEIHTEGKRFAIQNENGKESGSYIFGIGIIDQNTFEVGTSEIIQIGSIEISNEKNIILREISLLGITLRSDFPGEVSIIGKILRNHSD